MIWSFLSERITQHGESTFINEEEVYSYNDILEKVKVIGEKLKCSLRKKDKCGILCTSNMNTAIALLSCWYADLVPIPMSLNYGQTHCSKIIKDSKPAVLLIDDDIAKEFMPCYFDIRTLKLEGNVGLTYDDSLKDIGIIMYTSGTTGSPKGALIYEEGLIKNILAINEYFTINDRDRILIVRPLYHCAVITGEFLISLYKGLDIYFFDEKYNPFMVMNTIEKMGITVCCATPTLFVHLASLCKRTMKNNLLKVAVMSGECLTQEIAKKVREVFSNTIIYNVYGLTEASPRVSYLPPNLFDIYPESVGIPLKDINIKICNDEGHELNNNDKGNIYVNTPSIMKGYYGNEQLSKEKIKDGWLITGDVGYLNQEGYLFVLSRADDMIIKSGMNIYPREIENIVNNLPMIKECVAYRVSDNTGQNIGIDISLRDEYKNLKQKEIMIEFSKCLPTYLMPGYIQIVDIIPKNASGKIIRKRNVTI